MIEARRRACAKYHREKIKQYSVKLNKIKDVKLIEAIEKQENKNLFFKTLIARYCYDDD